MAIQLETYSFVKKKIRDLQREKSIGLPSYVEAYVNFMGYIYIYIHTSKQLQTPAVVTLTLLTVR